MNQTIKFAIVGVGHIGRRHIEMICKNEEAELSAIVDISPPNIFALSYPNIPFFTSLNEFLESNISTDVVVVATPNGLHLTHALECLDKFHVVVEKPLALKKDDAEKLVTKAQYTGRHLFTVMQNRYSPPAAWLKKLVADNILGNIFIVQINCYWNRDERYYTADSWHGKKDLDGGTLFTQFSHFIDIMYWLFGDVDNIKSNLYNFNHHHLTEFEDSGLINFDFINGGAGSIHYSTSVWDKNLESSMTIIAEKGSIKINGQYMDKVEYCHVKNYVMPELPTVTTPHHYLVIKNVIDVLKGRVKATTNSLEDVKVVDIIERIYNA